MKNIVFYFNSMTPAGGIERVIATLANKFSEFMEVTILVKDKAFSHYPLNSKIKIESLDNEIKFDLNSKLNRIKEAGRNLISSKKKLKKYLSNNKFDYYYIAHPLNVLEFYLAKGINKQVIITEHGGIDAYNKIYKGLKKWLYPKAKTYVVPTKTDTRLYADLGFPSVYIPHFKSALIYSKSLQDKKIAITIGRMTEAKRQWILIDLWNKIVHTHKILDWQLHIVGDGNLKEEYVKKIEKFQLKEYVTILPPIKDVENYYKEASFFLLTSQSEGFGMVILEAMSFGLPCVSYDCPAGPRDMITNNADGFLVEMDNFEALEKSTLEMITNREKMLEFGEQAYLVSKKWDDNSILNEWKKLLN
ncbi:glycosyltransferase [Pedobacter sp.]|uniref:glycosyltransferase n=1 Tax=Pedobacter sp. TaxID=1411316 RepID=UPI0031E4870A